MNLDYPGTSTNLILEVLVAHRQKKHIGNGIFGLQDNTRRGSCRVEHAEDHMAATCGFVRCFFVECSCLLEA